MGRCFFGKFMRIVEYVDLMISFYYYVYCVGIVKKKELKQIWNDIQKSDFFNKVKDKNNLKGKCGVCEYKNVCGGCRTAALFYTGDILGSDLRCGYITKALRKKT